MFSTVSPWLAHQAYGTAVDDSEGQFNVNARDGVGSHLCQHEPFGGLLARLADNDHFLLAAKGRHSMTPLFIIGERGEAASIRTALGNHLMPDPPVGDINTQ